MVGMGFKDYLSRISDRNDSRLILALDISAEDIVKDGVKDKYLKVFEEASDSIAAVKVGYPLVLKMGLEIITEIKDANDIPVIADFKIADVPHVCKLIASYAYDAGADAVIAQGFVGRDSLEAVVEAAEGMEDRGVIVVPNMTHEGGKMFIQPSSSEMLDLAREVGATGIIGPATRPEDVAELRDRAGDDLMILTPGIGAQGARPGDAIRNGANYEIVGRAIYTSEDPGKSAEEIRVRINEVIGEVEG